MVVDVAVLEFVRKGAEILGKNGHGRGIEQVLEASAQTQFEHVAHAESIDRTYVDIGSSEAYIGSEMINRVDPLTEVM